MMLRHNLHTNAQICGKSATQASLFVRHGRGVNRVYSTDQEPWRYNQTGFGRHQQEEFASLN